ncbi:MAG: OmpA family protein [Betaproteobacteria bacterium]|nr:OmpA family protein [Betaproteobacteria bacterium]
MRSIFIGLSVIFFSLSALITYKALNPPVYASSYWDNRPEIVLAPVPTPAAPPAPIAPPAPTATDTANHPAGESDADKAFAEDMKKTISQLENKLATTEETITNITTANTSTQPKTLAIFGGKTFRSGQDVIQDVTYSTIEKLVKEINASPNSRILIEGHTDNIPTGKSGSDNMDLSLRRAKAIANILALHGIPKDRISVTGYGDTQPINSNNTEEGRTKNRRVEVKLLPPEGAH